MPSISSVLAASLATLAVLAHPAAAASIPADIVPGMLFEGSINSTVGIFTRDDTRPISQDVSDKDTTEKSSSNLNDNYEYEDDSSVGASQIGNPHANDPCYSTRTVYKWTTKSWSQHVGPPQRISEPVCPPASITKSKTL